MSGHKLPVSQPQYNVGGLRHLLAVGYNNDAFAFVVCGSLQDVDDVAGGVLVEVSRRLVCKNYGERPKPGLFR